MPLQYNAKEIQLIEEAKPPTNIDTPETEPNSEALPKLPEDKKIDCPDPKKIILELVI